MTANLFVPPAAEGLPQGALDSATEGADRLDAAALTPTGRNFLAHALVQLARDGWLRPEPGEGFEAVRERPTVEPQLPAVVSSPPATDRATVRQQVIDALLEARRPGLGGMTEADAVAYMADAVMAALPGDGRATILREAADRYEGILAKANTGQDPRYWTAVRDITLGLRRMADEAQQQEPAVGVRQPDTETQASPSNRRALVHNAITDALSAAGDWVPLSIRIAATRAALAEVDAWHADDSAVAEQPAGGAGGVADETGEGSVKVTITHVPDPPELQREIARLRREWPGRAL